MASLFFKIMTRVVRVLDPHLEKYRPPRKKTPPYTPKTEKELIAVLKRTPETILPDSKRNLISSAMSFDLVPVSEIMVPNEHITYIHEDDFLGPFTLDVLYKTGTDYFPVLDHAQNVCGLIRPSTLSPLAISEKDTVSQFMTRDFCYVRSDYSLEMVLAALLRAKCFYCLVIDRESNIVGSVTLSDLVTILFYREIIDDFSQDYDREAVARRTKK